MTVQVDPHSLRYSVVVRPDQYEDGTVAYIAEVPELPGCKAHGASVEEALQNLVDAQREYIDALVEEQLPIPTPSPTPMSATVTWTVSVPAPHPGLPRTDVPVVSHGAAA
jgi:predicted RNase H-like HicB family nuclease